MLLSVPLSAAGGVLVAPLGGGMWTTGSLAGIFAVLALAVRSSIQLGHRIHAAAEAGGSGGHVVALDAARDRAVPLIQTVLVTAAVLLPAAVLGARAGLEFLHPLAVTMLGGLVSLLVVQLVLLPALLTTTAGVRREPPVASRPLAEATPE
jgi:Cu/Ag efflux pump CusA